VEENLVKNYFLAFVFAVLVALAGFSLRTLTAGSVQATVPNNAVAIGSAPVPPPPPTATNGMAIGSAPVPPPPPTNK
jgi:hypothetical protein